MVATKKGTKAISAEGTITKILYPRTAVHSGEFAIFKMALSSVEGEIAEGAVGPYGEVTFKGTVPSIRAGDGQVYSVSAQLVNDAKFGLQYQLDYMTLKVKLTTRSDQEKFFSYFLAPSQIAAIFSLDEDPIDILERHDFDTLTQVKGIGPARAQAIFERYEDTKDLSYAFSKLYDYGLSQAMIRKLVDHYNSSDIAVDKVRENPYVLIEEVSGIGWAKADAIALNAGMPENSPQRLRAFFIHYFTSCAENEGHTWITLDDLVAAVRATLPHSDDEIRAGLNDGIASNLLYYDKDSRRISLRKYRTLEEDIFAELTRLRGGKVTVPEDWKQVIEECKAVTGYDYTQEQENAIVTCLKNPVSLVTGLGGTGKSSIMLPFVKIMEKEGLSVAQCALSGKASLNLTEITGEQGKTIHKLLGWTPKGFIHTEKNPLNYDVVILDELSMVGGEIFLKLIQSIKTGARLVMLGDPGQLESIGLCNLIKDIEKSYYIPHYHLNKIFRQAARSGIITDSFEVYNGRHIVSPNLTTEETHGELQDFHIVPAFSSAQCAEEAVKWFKKFYFEARKPLEDIVIVTAKRSAGDSSCRVINTRVQAMLNLPKDKTIEMIYVDSGVTYSFTYHVGDRVLVTQNCYRSIDADTGKQTPIFNGNLGTIKEIDPREESMIVAFPQGDIVFTKALLGTLQLGYAITCHKCQGSGFPYVIYICDPSAYTLLSKEHLYTGITRAKKMCVLIGAAKIIRAATSTTRVTQKQTWLGELFAQAQAAQFKEELCSY